MIEITEYEQHLLVRKINLSQREKDEEDEAPLDHIKGILVYGRVFIVNNIVVIKDGNGQVEGMFSLDQYYILGYTPR